MAAEVKPTTEAANEPQPRRVDPHVRDAYVRVVNGRPISVEATIVNVDIARRQERLGVLTHALQLSRTRRPTGCKVATFTSEQSRQLDLVDELNAAMRRRGCEILDERLDRYARLTMIERCHLAMARVRVTIEESAARAMGGSDSSARKALEQMESLMFVASLQRLNPFDSASVREAFRARALASRTVAQPVVDKPQKEANVCTLPSTASKDIAAQPEDEHDDSILVVGLSHDEDGLNAGPEERERERFSG